MKRSEKLAPVERLASLKEQQASRQLADAQHRLQEEQARGQQLQSFRNEYLQEMKVAGRTGLSGAHLRRYTTFSNQIDQMITVQNEQIQRSEQHLQQVRQAWQSSHARRRAVSELGGRFEAAEQRESDRIEQKQLDELNTARARFREDS